MHRATDTKNLMLTPLL